MGLFGKKDKDKEKERGSCAICGGMLPRFTFKVDGQEVCDACYGIVDLPKEILNNITLDGFKEYMVFRDRNNMLRQQFQITRKVDFGWFSEKIMFDEHSRLLCMDKKLKKVIYEGCQVRSFEIREDDALLFSGSAEGLVRYTSTVPDRVRAMAPKIEQLRMQLEMKREMERMLEERRNETGSSGSYSMPTVNVPVVFRKFIVEIHIDHPYWPLDFKAEKKAPGFSDTEPDIDNYLADYNEAVQFVEGIVQGLMAVAFPDAPERTVAPASTVTAGSGGVSAPGVVVDTVEELQRLKELMDKGILTEEEFTAKKRQMLGI